MRLTKWIKIFIFAFRWNKINRVVRKCRIHNPLISLMDGRELESPNLQTAMQTLNQKMVKIFKWLVCLICQSENLSFLPLLVTVLDTVLWLDGKIFHYFLLFVQSFKHFTYRYCFTSGFPNEKQYKHIKK